MNSEIRTLLIERARSGKPIYYGEIMNQLGLIPGVERDHIILSKVLADISRFEHYHKRPLLSSIATYNPETSRMYKGELHGNGFYELAEELGFGKKSRLKKDDFGIGQMKLCTQKWSDQKFYSENIDIAECTASRPLFFTKNEIDFLSTWANKVYNKHDPLHVDAKNTIMSTLSAKTVYWSNELINRLQGYETFNWRMWSQKGWADTANGKKQVARFKPYTWARIYKVGDEYKDIFFTVGVDAEIKALIYKLDYYFEKNSTLSSEQQELCRQIIPKSVSRLTIPYDNIPAHNWDTLISITLEFIQENDSLYNNVVRCVWTNSLDLPQLKNCLVKRDPPKKGFFEIPERQFQFNGLLIDWQQHEDNSSAIGSLGEQLVIDYEKGKLLGANKPDLAEKVQKQLDGAGYDILSYDSEGNEKKIEVKATTGGPNAPFAISLNEIVFSEKNAKHYSLYRVFNLKIASKVGEFFEVKGSIKEHFLLEGINFHAFKKSIEVN